MNCLEDFAEDVYEISSSLTDLFKDFHRYLETRGDVDSIVVYSSCEPELIDESIEVYIKGRDEDGSLFTSLQFTISDMLDNCAIKVIHGVSIICEQDFFVEVIKKMSDLLMDYGRCSSVMLTASEDESSWYNYIEPLAEKHGNNHSLISTFPSRDFCNTIKMLLLKKTIK